MIARLLRRFRALVGSMIGSSARKPPESARERAEPLIKAWASAFQRVPAAVLAGVAVLALALAVWSSVSAHELRTGGPAGNTALTDVAANEAVIDAVTEAVETIFSYEYRDTDRTREAARELLVGPAVERYEEVFAHVEQQAAERRTVLSTAVRSVGVAELRDGRASVLVFVDQQTLQTGAGHTSGATQLEIEAVRIDGVWKIDGLTVL